MTNTVIDEIAAERERIRELAVRTLTRDGTPVLALIISALRTYGEECRAAERSKWEPDALRYRHWRDWALIDYSEERLVDPLMLALSEAETAEQCDAALDAAIREARHD